MMQDPSLLEAAEEPTVEEAGEAEITPEEVMEAVSEMVDAGEISEEQANEIVEEIVQGAAEDEEVAAADDAALAEEAIAAGEDEAGDAAALEAAAAEGPAKLASEIVRGTILLKKASADAGIVEDEEANIQDVVSVVQQLAEEGSISEEEARAVITEIAEFYEKELGYKLPPRTPFVGRDFNVTRAGIHADGVAKDEEIYNIFNTAKILNRPLSVEVNKNSGLSGVAYWMNQTVSLPDGRKIGKNDPEAAILKEWVDKQYEGGRMTFISEEEMEAALKTLLPDLAKYMK
jgi:isopropylmalate/homocitrate/citramalate synthase